MPMPRGRQPSTAALTRFGAMKAREMVMLTCRTLQLSRVQSSATVVTRPETTSSSHRRPRAITGQGRATEQDATVLLAETALLQAQIDNLRQMGELLRNELEHLNSQRLTGYCLPRAPPPHQR